MSDNGSSWFSRKRASASRSKESKAKKPRARRRGIMALEPRMMYDGAAHATAAHHYHHHDGAGDLGQMVVAENLGQMVLAENKAAQTPNVQAPPPPSITTVVTQPVNGGTVEVQGTGKAGETIRLYADGNTTTVVGTGKVGADGTFDITTSASFAAGAHTFTATESSKHHASAASSAANVGANVATWVRNPNEIVFIDQQVPDYQALVAGVNPGTEVVLINANSDGVQQIADFLSSNPDPNLTKIDIVGHGQAGELTVGSTNLTDANLAGDKQALATIGQALVPGGEIALYGCDVAQGAVGQQFITDLAADAGGVRVAASTQNIGTLQASNATFENWSLDVASSGPIDTSTPFTTTALASYQGLLANTTVTGSSITTTLTVDADGDGGTSPGDTVTSQITITNTTGTAASGATVSVNPAGLTAVPNSVEITSIAVNDSYSMVGNTTLTVNAANGVLANDIEFNGATLTTTGVVSNVVGGTVTLNADGSFTFVATAGFAGTASFQYTSHDVAGNSDQTATVSINVTTPTWYVSTTGSDTTGNGTSANPFASIAKAVSAAAADAAGGNGVNNIISVAAGTYTGSGITLASGEQLIGSGSGITSLSVSTGAAVTLNSGNIINGITIKETGTGAGIVDDGGTIGTLTMSNVAVGTASGTGISLTHGGTVNITGTGNTLISGSGTALDIENTNIGSNGITFKFISDGGAGTTSGNAIVLNNTGSSGGLTVTGDGSTAQSGGLIENKSGIGIDLVNTIDVSLAYMTVTNTGNDGIYAQGVTNFSMDHSTVATAGSAIGQGSVIFGASSSYAGSTTAPGVTGIASITNSTISGGWYDNLDVIGQSGVLDLTLNNDTFNDNNTAHGNQNVFINPEGSAVINATVTNSTWGGVSHGSNFFFDVESSSNIGSNLSFTGNTVGDDLGGPNGDGGSGIVEAIASSVSGSTTTFDIENNSFNNSVGASVIVVNDLAGSATTTALLNVTFSHNTIGTVGKQDSGGAGFIAEFNGGTMNMMVANNTINDFEGTAIDIVGGEGLSTGNEAGTLNATIIGNTIGNVSNDANGTNGNGKSDGIDIDAGGANQNATDLYIFNVTIGGSTAAEKNTINLGATDINNLGTDILIAQDGDTHTPFAINLTAQTATVGVLSAYSGPGNDSGGQVEAFLESNNTSSDGAAGFFELATNGNAFGGGSPTSTVPAVSIFGTPTIGGTAAEGNTLMASALGTSNTYQWQEAFASGEWIDIFGANSSSFTLSEAQVGAAIRVVETSVYSSGLVDTVASTATATVADHLTVTTPSISGTDTVGQILTASTPTASNSDATLSYQWELNSGSGFVAISGANGQTFRLVAADAGDTVEVVVTATDPHGGNISATSAATGTIAAFTAPTLSSLALGTLPGNDKVTVTWEATVNAQSNGLIVNPTYASSISGSNFATTNVNSSVTLDSLTLSGEIFNDADNSGLLKGGDIGLAGVSVSVFAQGGSTALETTTTNASGLYSFTGLAAGNYFVQINAANFSSGGALAAYTNSSSGRDATPNDYLGNRSYGLTMSNGVVDTNAITLAYNTPHPSGANTYPGNDTTNTLDIGLIKGPIVTGGGTTTDFYQSGSAPAVDSGLVVTDPAGANITGATVTISSGFTAGDTLTFNGGSNTETFTDGSTIKATQSGGVLTLTTTSGNATAADYQKALDSVTYNFAGDPTAGGTDHVRTLSYQVTDANSASSASVVSTLDVFALPIVSIGAFTAPTVTAASGAVVADPNISLTDNNGTTLQGATVTISGGAQAGDTLTIGGLTSGTVPGTTITFSFSGSTLTLSGNDTVADYQTALREVKFDAVSPNGGTRTLSWTVNDAAGGNTNNSAPVTTNVDVVFGPVVNAGAPSVTFVGGSSTAVTLDSGITVSDSESTTLTQATVTISSGLQPGDLLSFNNGTNTETFGSDTITASYNSSTGVLTLSGTATVAEYQTALSQVQFGFNNAIGGTAVDPTAGGADLSRGITWQVTDGTHPSTGVTTTLNVVHTAPTETASGAVAYESGGAAVAIDGAATVSDPDSGNGLTGATISIGAGGVAGDALMIGGNTSGTLDGGKISYQFANSTLTLTGADSLAAYQAALDAITFSTTSATAGNRTIDWSVTDGSSSNGSSATATSTVNVALGPQVTAGGAVNFTGGSTAAVTLDPTLSLTDQASANLQSATVTIGPANFQTGDVLSFNNGTNTETFGDGATITAHYSNGVLSLSGTASVADYQTALQQVQFGFNGGAAGADPTAGGTDTTRNIGWTVSDAAVTSNSASSTLNVVHTAPTVTAGGSVNFELGSTAPVTLDGAAVVGDPDSGGNLTGATVLIRTGFINGADTLMIGGSTSGTLDGGKISYVFSGASLTLTGTDSLAAYQAALDSITFSTTDTTIPARTITWTVTDGSTSNGTSAVATSGVDLEPGPAVIAGSSATFTEGGGAVTLDNSVNVTDPASTTLTGAKVTIGNFVSGDTLNFTNQNNITGSYNASTGVLTLSGTDTVADYQAALQSISYVSTATDPTNGGADTSRTVSWAVSDGVGTSNAATSRLNVLGANQAPTATASTATYNATEDTALNLKNTGLSVGDADNDGGIETATLSVGEGILTVTAGTSGATVTGSGTSTVTITGNTGEIDALLNTNGTSTVSYTDNNPHPGASTALTLSIDDNGNTGTGGAKTASATATIDVTAVNHAPVVVATSYTVTENNTLTVPAAAGVLSVDSDPNGDALTAALVTNVAHGTLTLNSDGSFTYTPAAGYTGTDSFTYKASDGALQSGTVTVTLNVASSGSSAAAGEVYITTTGSDVVGDTSVKSANPNGTNLTTIFADSSVDGSGHDQPVQSPTDIVIDAADNLYFMLGTETGVSGTVVLTGHLNSSAAPTVFYADPDTGGTITSISIDPTTHTLYVGQDSSYTNGTAANNGIFSFNYNASSGALISGSKTQLVSYSPLYNGDIGQNGAFAGTQVGNLSSTVANGFLYFEATSYYTSTGTSQVYSLNLANDTVTALTPANQFSVTYYYTSGGSFVATGGSLLGTIQVDPTLNKVYFEVYTDTVDTSTFKVTETSNELYNVTTSGTLQATAALSLSAGGFAIDTSTGNFLVTDISTQSIDVYSSNSTGSSLTFSSSFTLGLAPYNAADPNSGAGPGSPYDYPTSIFVVPGQQPPTVSAASGYDATEQVALSLKNAGLSISDPSGTGASETLTLSVGEGVLDVTAGTSGANISGNDSSSVTITGTVAQIDALLNTDGTSTITYTDKSFTPSRHTTLALSVTDSGGLTASDTAPIFITAVNQAPVASVSLTSHVTDAGTALSLKNDGLSVSDVDGGSGVETATLSVGEGVLDVTAGSSGASVSGSGTSSVTISGTVAQIDALLNTDASSTVSYIDNSATPAASTTLTLSIDDNGHTGTGGALTSTPATGTVNIEAAPVITTSGSTVAYGQGNQGEVVDNGTPGITVTDGSGTLASATVSIGNFQAGDVLGFSASELSGNKVVIDNGTVTTNITESYNSATGQLTLTGSDSLADYQAALAEVQFRNTAATPSTSPRTVTFTVNDGKSSSNSASDTVDVVAQPVVTAGATVTFDGGGSPVTLDSGLTLNDQSSATLNGAAVTIVGAISGDTLSFNNGTNTETFTDGGVITATFNGTALVMQGTASVADYQAALRSVSYGVDPANGDPTGAGRTIDWTVVSNGLRSAIATSTLNTVHVAPVVTAGTPSVTFTGGGAAVALDSGITVSDVDSGGSLSSATVTISGFVSGDTLSFTNNGTEGDITSATSGTGQLTLTSAGGAATLAQWNAALEAITYSFSPSNGDPTNGGGDTSRSISWQVTDGSSSNGTSNTGVTALSVSHVAPVVTTGTPSVTFDGGGSAVTLDSGITLSDADSGGNLTGATVTIAPANLQTGDVLSFNGTNTETFADNDTISAIYNNGVLSLTGTASVADYQMALQRVQFGFTAGGDPTAGGGDTSRSISWQVTDSSTSHGTSNTGVTALSVEHVAPSVTAGADVGYAVGGSAVQLDSGLAVNVVDSAGDLTSATVSIGPGFSAGDILNFADANGITGHYDSSTGVLTLTSAGPLAAGTYQTALGSITFSTTNSTIGPRTIDWQVSDGSSSNGSSAVATSTLTVSVAPAVTAGATETFNGGGSPVTLDPTFTITQGSSPTLAGAAVTIDGPGFVSGVDTLGFTTNATLTAINEATPDHYTLTFADSSSITAIYDPTSGKLALSGTDSVADYQAALQAVTYGAGNNDPTNGGGDTSRTIEWSVTDSALTSNTASSTLNTVHVAPSVTPSGSTADYSVGTAAVAVDSGLTLSDPDSGDILTKATVTIGSGFVSGDDVLAFNNNSHSETFGSGDTITASYSNGVLALTGNATVAEYKAALDSVTFVTSATSAGSRVIDWTVSDAASTSVQATSTVDVVLGPRITGVVGQPINGGTVELQGTGGTVGDTIKLYADGGSTVVGTGTILAGGTFDITTSVSFNDGIHTFTATETNGGNTAISPGFAVDVDPSAPVISAVAGQPVNNGHVTLEVTGEVGETVNLYADGNTATIIGSGIIGASGTVDITTTANYAEGVHSFTATETDSAPLTSAMSSAFSVNVDPVAPVITTLVGQPVNGGTVDLQGTGQAGDVVDIFADGNTLAIVGIGVVDGTGHFDITTTTRFADGVHTFSATETNLATSLVSPVSTPAFTVDIDPNAPVNLAVTGQPVNGQDVTVTGKGETQGDTITIYNGATMLGTTTVGSGGTFSFTTSAPFADGVYSFTATETDSQHLTSAASPLTVDVDPNAPVNLAVTGQPVNGQTVSLTGTGETAGDIITISNGATVLGTTTVGVGGTFSFTTATTFADGVYHFTATETDSQNLTSAASPLTVDVNPNAPAITALVGQPQNGQTVELQGTGEAGDTVHLYADGGTTIVGSGIVDGTGHFDISTTAGVADGTHGFTATETDGAGLSSAATPAFSVAVEAVAPTNLAQKGTTTNGGTIEITGIGDAVGDTITISNGTTEVGSGKVGANGTFDIVTSTFADGIYQLTAVNTSVDKTETSAASSPLTVNVDPNAPVITAVFGQPVDGGTIELKGTGEAGDIVNLYADGSTTVVGTGTVGSDGTFDIITTATFTGLHTFTATETDKVNLTSAASSPGFPVNLASPLHTFTDNSVQTSQPNITLASLVDDVPRGPLLPSGYDIGAGSGSGFSFNVVHTDPVLATAADANVQINLALASLEAPLGGDVVYVEARQADGKPLPDWLKFDPATGTFAGLPPDNALASLAPDRSSDNNIVTGTLKQDFNDGSGRHAAGSSSITIEVLARDSKGNVAVTVFTIDLKPHNAGQHGWNMQPFGVERHASLTPLSRELAAIEAAVRDVTRSVEPFVVHGMTLGHGESIAVGAHETLPAGRAGLTEQLGSIGWRSMAAQRNALLASLQQGR